MKIAIVGMGVAGISALREWTRKKRIHPSIELTVYGDEKTFGRGLPYQKDDSTLLLNQPAETMTIVPENNNNFAEWMQETHYRKHPKGQHYPRTVFGDYLTERMNKWLEESEATVRKIRIETIRVLPNGQYNVSSSTEEEVFDAVHLCIGHARFSDPFNLENHSRFIYDPFPVEEKLQTLPLKARVGILGTGLTAIDIFRYVQKNRPDLQLSFYSRSGRFKSIRGEYEQSSYYFLTEENIQRTKLRYNGFIPLDMYFHWMKKEANYRGISAENIWNNGQKGSKTSLKKELEHREKLGTFQSLLHNMDPMLPELWSNLTETDKQKFLKGYLKTWEKLRSPLPASTGEELVEAWEREEISIYGDLENVKDHTHSFEMITNNESKTVDYLINASGPNSQVTYSTARSPLVKQLLNERILQPEPFGGVQVTWPKLSAVTQKYGVLDNFKIHGQLISGIEFGNNAVNIVSESVRPAVNDIADRMKD